jgi:hypothetical protein
MGLLVGNLDAADVLVREFAQDVEVTDSCCNNRLGVGLGQDALQIQKPSGGCCVFWQVTDFG